MHPYKQNANKTLPIFILFFVVIFLFSCTLFPDKVLGEDVSALPQSQYKLRAKAFTLENLAPYLSVTRTQKHKIGKVEYGFLSITTKEKQYVNPGTYNVADITGLSNAHQPLIDNVREALTAIGWNPAPKPHLFLTARQAHSIYQNAFIPSPISLEDYLADKGIPQGLEDTTYLCSIAQLVDGFPLYDRISQGSDDQHASLYALLWVDEEGKIISGNIAVPYEIEKTAPLTASLLTNAQGEEALLAFIKELDGTFQDFYDEENLTLSYKIESANPCLVVNNTYVALPAWQYMLHAFYTDNTTGEVTHSYWDASINALTGQ